jgi:ribosomal-protein-alanine N-acetyltransferase
MNKIEIKDIGFLEYSLAEDVIDVVDIFVNDGQRCKGFACKMMSELLQNHPHCEVFLEVRISNFPAINLYKKFGFVTVNVRKNYYENEDALLMQRRINPLV